MGISLWYQAQNVLDEETRSRLLERAHDLGRAYDWWSEPLKFLPPPLQEEKFAGFSKVFLVEYGGADIGYVRVDRKDDLFMAWLDVTRITNELATLSREFGITWQLTLEGEDLGQIDEGGLSKATQAYLAEWSRKVDANGRTHDEIEARARSISMHYASRNV